MSEVNFEVVKDYWPYILGGVVGLYLVSKYYSTQSTGNTGTSSVIAYNPAAAAAAQAANAQNYQLQASANIAAANAENQRLAIIAKTQIDAANAENQRLAITAANQIATEQTANQTLTISTAAQNANIESQAHMATAIINGAVQLAAAQSLIPIAAINSATKTNQATLLAGANIATSGNNALAAILNSEALAVAQQSAAVGQGAGVTSNMIQNINAQNAQANNDATGMFLGTGLTAAALL